MIIIISNNLEILLQENLKRPPISWSANHVLSYENDFFSSPYSQILYWYTLIGVNQLCTAYLKSLNDFPEG